MESVRFGKVCEGRAGTSAECTVHRVYCVITISAFRLTGVCSEHVPSTESV